MTRYSRWPMRHQATYSHEQACGRIPADMWRSYHVLWTTQEFEAENTNANSKVWNRLWDQWKMSAVPDSRLLAIVAGPRGLLGKLWLLSNGQLSLDRALAKKRCQVCMTLLPNLRYQTEFLFWNWYDWRYTMILILTNSGVSRVLFNCELSPRLNTRYCSTAKKSIRPNTL